MKKIKLALMSIGILLTFYSYCQDIPLGTLPMQYNGGFAGEGKGPRFNLGGNYTKYKNSSGYYYTPYQNHITMHDDYYSTIFTSYDQFISKIRTGIGVTFQNTYIDYNSNYDLKNANGSYLLVSASPKFSFEGKYTFAPFIDFSYSDTQYNKLLHNSSDSIPSMSNGFHSSWAMKGRSGFLFNTKKFYFGATFYVFNNHSIYYRSSNPTLILQTGYTFQKRPESKFSFTPQLAFKFYKFQNQHLSHRNVNVNLMARYKHVLWSLNNDGTTFGDFNISAGLGYQTKKFRVLLNRNITDNRYQTNGTLSFRYVLN